ncbi:MAG: tetratricopeptide repeat protein [Desulfatibacillum sp.]|nr:tetratricopeptide repeat protein [Desulfatibacillum sp.]
MHNQTVHKWLFLAMFCLVCIPEAGARGLVRKVETQLKDGKTQIMVSVANPSSYTVIRLSKNEVLLAFQDTTLDSGAKKPKLAKDTLVRELSVSQKRQDVVSILALLKEPALSLTHSMNMAKSMLTMEMTGAVAIVQKPVEPIISQGNYEVEGKPTIERPAGPDEIQPPPEPEITPEIPKPLVKPPGDARYPIMQPHDPATQGYDFKYDGPLINQLVGTGTPDQQLYAKAVEAYKAGQWQQAIQDLTQLQQDFPVSDKIEAATFLLARAYHGLYTPNLSKRLVDVAEKYRQAIKQFPDSQFSAQAIAHLAEMYLTVGNYPEAAAYCDLVWDRYKNLAMTPDFMLLRGKALLANGQKEQALGVFDMLLGYYPDSEYVEPTQLEKAKILYEERAYKQSLEMLQAIESKNPQARFIYPDQARYMGENYYQLGSHTKARELLFETINMFPETEDEDIVLTKIGDTYKEQGFPDKAAMIFRMVASNYPGSDGRLISLVRLADYMEENPGTEIMDDRSARDIHKEIVRNNPDHPLAQVSMIKLARLAYDEKKYEESVSILLSLLARHPFTKLHDDVREALLASLEAIFLRDHKEGNYAHIVEYYDKVRDVVPFEEMPQLMFIVANAYRETGMCSWALTQLEKISRYYDDPKPAEILFIMADCNKSLGEFEKARKLFETFILQYPGDPRYVEAHYQLADIYLDRDDSERAIHSLRVCLQPGTPYSDDFNLLFKYAKMLKNQEKYEEAVSAYQKAVVLVMEADPPNTGAAVDIHERIGDLYEKMDLLPKAVESYENALELAGGPNSYPALEFKIARCLALMGQMERATQILESLAQSGQNVWAKAAKAKLEQVLVKGAWDKTS